MTEGMGEEYGYVIVKKVFFKNVFLFWCIWDEVGFWGLGV